MEQKTNVQWESETLRKEKLCAEAIGFTHMEDALTGTTKPQECASKKLEDIGDFGDYQNGYAAGYMAATKSFHNRLAAMEDELIRIMTPTPVIYVVAQIKSLVAEELQKGGE